MSTHTFPCPFCGRRMGVESKLLGRNVRCPHCKQVILAPTTTTTANPERPSATVPVPQPLQPTPAATPLGGPTQSPPPSSQDIPDFNITRREAADSILGDPEESDDEVFSSSPAMRLPKPIIPDTSQTSGPHDPLDFLKSPPAPSQQVPKVPEPSSAPPPTGYTNPYTGPVTAASPAAESANPFGDLDTPPAPPPPARVPVSPSKVAPAPPPIAPQPFPKTTASPDNPWAGFDETATQTVPAELPVPTQPPPPLPSPAEMKSAIEPTRRGEPSRQQRTPTMENRVPQSQQGNSQLFKVGFYILLPYALLMTVLAVYGLLLKSSRLDADHPLSTIPDNFGEFPAAERKKVGKYSFPVDGPLPANQKVTLGDKLAIGSLEIEPVRVQARDLTVVRTAKVGIERTEQVIGQAIVLSLKIRNTSSDLSLYPMDPAFTRKGHGNEHPATGIVVGNQTFWGGAIDWPVANPRVRREFESAQEADANALKPGESRNYVIFTDAKREIVAAIQGADSPLLWRVQLRHGLVQYRGHDVPVTAIIGVEFKPDDVK